MRMRSKQPLQLGIVEAVALLPNGFKTTISDSVTDPIPPGLKQRIAIARSLARKPSVIMFDNADRGLDREGYNLVFKTLGRLKGKITMIFVSDDRNILRLADKEYYLVDGKLEERPPEDSKIFSLLPFQGFAGMNGIITEKFARLRDCIEPYGWLSRTGAPSPYAECIAPLLVALGWNGEIHQLCESLPHYPDRIDRVDTINVLTNLNYGAEQTQIATRNFDERLCPCLVVSDMDGSREMPCIFFSAGDGSVQVFDGSVREIYPLATFKPKRVDCFFLCTINRRVAE